MAATEVLSAQSKSQIFHQPRPRRTSPPQSSLFLNTSPSTLSSSPKQHSLISSAEHHESVSEPQTPSSTDSSPSLSMVNFSNPSSLNSTPLTSGLSLDDERQPSGEDIDFPNYDGLHYATDPRDDGCAYGNTDAPEVSTTTGTTRSDSPPPTTPVADDTAIKQEPSQHVDYLSHNWREEDIWASWRNIVSQRRVYGQKSRLENASWRTWAKFKYDLPTISPDSLNWLKDSDVTWLYGPLKPAQSHPITSDTSTPPSQLSKSGSFINKKPILKKRSVSEVMLQKSLSTSSLVKQAAASVQAQQTKSPLRRGINRTNSEFSIPVSAPSQPPSRDDFDYFSSRSSSAVDETPSEGKEKHIRFDEVVEQCVAVDVRDSHFDDEEEDEENESSPHGTLSESSSDEGLVMMRKKPRSGPKSGSSQKGRLSRSNSTTGKMIETIPATTLKNRTDSPDVTQQQPQHHTFGHNWSSGMLSPSPSQETLRPTRPSRNFLLADDDDADDPNGGENSSTWSFGASNPKSSLGASAASPSSSSAGPSSTFNYTDGYVGMEGMRRTESGMFMPIEDDEDDLVAAGLFGRVSETVNTVKDIGWVLWNSFSSRRDS